MLSDSLIDGPNHHLPSPGSGKLLATLFQSPPLNPTPVSPVWPRSYLLSCGLHTCQVSLPPNTLSCASASPLIPGAPPHCRPLFALSVPNLAGFIPLSIQAPQVPGHPSPSPCPAVQGFSVSPRQSSLPLIAPIPSPRTKPPQFLHHRTWPAGRRPPHAGLRPEQEEGGGKTETEGSGAGSCRRDSPASGSAPRPAPGPKPTLPHPPRTRRGLRRAAWLGWEERGPRSPRGDSEKGRRAPGTMRQPAPGLGRPLLAASLPVSGARCSAGPCSIRCPRPPQSEAGRSAQRCPPAVARGLHPRSPLVRLALLGCSPSVGPGPVCGCGSRVQ